MGFVILVTLVCGVLVVVVEALMVGSGGRGYLQQAWESLALQLNLSFKQNFGA